MPLDIGDRIGPYQITALLGQGGMGTVFRARDARLNRDVAVKVVSDDFAADPERLARFTREAHALASLSHANIAAIYGVEESGAIHAIVMELVEGDDLSGVIAAERRSSTTGLDMPDALRIARQLADALEAAHEQGIIHRDLKPANIKVRPDGTIKVLDFGLAKAVQGDGQRSGDAMNSPTLTARATAMGMVLGTAAYMAPEQARGKVVDKRADVWAFGVVLFEMLTGDRLFKGDEITDVLAAVLRQDVDWTALPANVPPSIRRLLRRCLEKDPRKRLSAIADARLELDDVNELPTVVASAAAVPSRIGRPRKPWLAILAAAAAAAVLTAGGMLTLRSTSNAAATGVIRMSILAPTGSEFYPDSTMVALSPDGTMVAFVVGDFVDREAASIWVRRLDSLRATKVEGSDGGFLPFWKPDGTRVGFFAGRKLKTAPIAGGHVDEIADADFGRGASWNQHDVIVFSGDTSGTLNRVSGSGGETVRVTTLDASRKESGHRFPVFLPDGDHFLYAALPGHDGKFDILAGSLSHPSVATLVGAMGNTPAYAPAAGGGPGWLLFARQGVLVAQSFDPASLKTTGEAVALADEPSVIFDPQISYTAGHVASASATGALAYYSGTSTRSKAVWIDSTGRVTGAVVLKAGRYSTVRLSPDGTQAVVVRSISPTESSVWLVDLTRASMTLLSTGGGRNDAPIWSPDGTRVVFSSDRNGPQDFYVKNIADGAPERLLFASDSMFKTPTNWTADGRSILFHQILPSAAYDVYAIASTGQGAATLVAGGRMRELGAASSPNGQWVSFLSEDTGRLELYLQSFPQAGRRVQVSLNGASRGWWTPDGRQLIYLTADLRQLWRADLDYSGSMVRVGTPVQLGTLPAGVDVAAIDAMPDRHRFLAMLPDETGTGSATIVQGWRTAIEKSR